MQGGSRLSRLCCPRDVRISTYPFTAHLRHRFGAQAGWILAFYNPLNISSEARELAHSEAVRALVEPVLGERFFPVQGILFDKIPDANWKVPWYQDVTIAVEAEGFGP